MKEPKVLLASLPWTSLVEPSLGLGILKSELQRNSIDARVSHLNLLLLKHMRASTYVSIANMFALNEFLFTYFFEQNLSKEQLSELSIKIDEAISNNTFQSDDRYNDRESIAKLFLNLRNKIIPDYIIECVEQIESYNPTMVGFTCMFDQTIPSLVIAKLLKIRNPTLFIVLGGYALEGVPGKQIIESFDFIDCIAYGEGEKVITQLALASVGKESLENIPDILFRDKKSSEVSISKISKKQIKLDESPCPNYDDFISDIDFLEKELEIKIKWNTIPIETSRGCWWGQKKHCIFCGIDDVTMKYRQRSVENTISILSELRTKYNTPYFRISDYILPHTYYNDLLPYLAKLEEGNKYVFTCEIKANIKEEQFELLKDAGFIEVQPGIESFSSNILRKMDKGVSAIQNIYCIILGLKHTVQVNYNIIYGFPDDEVEDYKEMIKTIPLLYHLNPPSSRIKVAITRFAPLQTNPKRFGFTEPYKHHPGYNVLFSKKFLAEHNFDLSNYCYYFESPYSNSSELEYLYNMLDYQVDYWRSIHQEREVYLIYECKGESIKFIDTRFDETPIIKEYNNKFKEVYFYCAGQISSINEISEKTSFNTSEVKKILNRLVEDRIVYNEGSKYLGLALAESCYENIKIESNKWSKPYV